MKLLNVVLFLFSISLIQAQELSKTSVLKISKEDFVLIKKQNEVCFYAINNKFIIDCPDDYSSIIDTQVVVMDTSYILEIYHDQLKTKIYSRGLANKYCYTGDYKEYAVNGDLVVKGHFKSDSIGSNCNIKDGEWIFYENSNEVRKEVWNNGFLVSLKGWEPLPIYNAKILINERQYTKGEVSLRELKNISIELSLSDNELNYGRFTCRLMVTGAKRPVKQLTIDYMGLEYFNFKEFLTDYWKSGSQLFIEITDTKTGTYFNTYINFKE